MSCTVPRMESLKKSFLLLSLLFLALVNANGSRHVGQQGHHGHSGHEDDQHGHGGGGGHGHREPERRVQREPGHHPQHHHESPGHHGPPMGGGPPCGCGGSGRQFMGGQQANGVPLFLFPEHAQKAVDVILGAEGAFYWDNDELAHRVFDLLAHKFPRHRFLVGVGNSPAAGRGLHIERHSNRNLLHGSLKVSPGHTPFAFFDRRQFPRENETQLWYFVYAVEAQVAKVRTGEPRYAECLGGAENQCLPTDIAVKCGLDLLILIEQKTQPALYASDSLDNPKMLNVLSSVNRCQADTQEEGEGREISGNNTSFYAVMAMATDWMAMATDYGYRLDRYGYRADVQKSKKARKQEVSESEEV